MKENYKLTSFEGDIFIMNIFKRTRGENEVHEGHSRGHHGEGGDHAAAGDQKLDAYSYKVLLGMLFLLPIIFIPSIAIPFQLTKTIIVFAGILIAFLIALISRLKEGKLALPVHNILYGVWLLPFVYFLSALFSSSPSLSYFGQGLESDTFVFILLMAVFVSLLVMTVRKKEQVLTSYLALFGSFILLWVFQGLRLLFGPEFLSFNTLTLSTSNVFGKWNDLSIFFGLATVMSLVVLASLKLSGTYKKILYVMLVVSLFFLAVVNFTITWLIVGLFALGFLVHSASIGKFKWKKAEPQEVEFHEGEHHHEHNKDEDKEEGAKFSYAALIVFIVAAIFVLGGDSVGNYFSNKFEISQIEARPSWQSTINIGKSTYADSAIFGSGPNTFVKQWVASRPSELNNSIFWNADFISGIGVIPTAFVSGGLAGGFAWLLLMGLFIWSGIKSLLLSNVKNRYTYFISLSSFLAGVYLWLMMIFYTPNVVLVTLAFFFTGIYLASLRHHTDNRLKERSFVFANNPKTGFASVFILTFLLLLTVVGMYSAGKTYFSAVKFQSGVIALNVDGDVDRAQDTIVAAAELDEQDRQFRLLSDISVARLVALQSETDISEEELRNRFQLYLAQAIEAGQRATELDPNNYQNWLALGRVYQSVVPLGIEGAYENAETSFAKALELNPNGPGTYLTLARLEVSNGDTLKARDYIAEALTLKSNYTDAIFLLSQIEISEGNVDEAIKSIEAAALLTQNNPVIHFQLGLLKYNQGDDAGAIQAFQNAIFLSPDYANAKYFLGLALDRVGETEAAIAQFEDVGRLNPENEEVAEIIKNLNAGRSPFAGEPAPEPIPEELPFEEGLAPDDIDEPGDE
jgi:tetratricopeptide (TPR) repeat protein